MSSTVTNTPAISDNDIARRKLWRASDVAVVLGVGQRLAERLMQQNSIRSIILGNKRVTTPQFVDEYIDKIFS